MPIPVEGIYASARSQGVVLEKILHHDREATAEVIAAKKSRLRELVRQLRISVNVSEADKKAWGVFVNECERGTEAIEKNLGFAIEKIDWDEISASLSLLISVIQHLETVVCAPVPLCAVR